VCDLLKRHHLIPKAPRRPRLSHPGRPFSNFAMHTYGREQ